MNALYITSLVNRLGRGGHGCGGVKEKVYQVRLPLPEAGGSIEKGYILENTKEKQIVEIRVKGGKYIAKPHSEAYVNFAMLHPAIIP